MIQDTITWILIACCTGYIVYGLYRLVYPSKNGQPAGCPGCGGCEGKNVQPDSKSTPSGISHRRFYSSDPVSVPGALKGRQTAPLDFAAGDWANRQR
jgi:hypothetical protein